MAKQLVTSPALSPAVAPYPAGLRVGNLVFISGIVATDSEGKLVGRTRGKTDMAAQTTQVLTVIQDIARLLDSDSSRLAWLKTFVTDWKFVKDWNLQRRFLRNSQRLLPAPSPAGAAAMGGLAQEGLLLETEGIAIEGQPLEPLPMSHYPPLKPYLRGGVRAGDLLFLSACTPLSARGRLVAPGNARAQSVAALDSLSQALAAAGFSPADVVRTVVTVADDRDLPTVYDVYRGYFKEPYPAMTAIQGLLPVTGMLVQVEAWASRRRPRTVVAPGQKWSDRLSPPPTPSSHAVQTGDLVFLSALPSLSPAGRLSGAGDMRAQTLRCLEQLETTLDLVGLTPEDVVKTTIYMTDWRAYWPYNNAYGEFFQEPYPARSSFRTGLPIKGSLIQMDAIAVAGASTSARVAVSDRTFWRPERK